MKAAREKNSHIQVITRKAGSWFLSRDFAGQERLSWYTPRARRKKIANQ